MCIIFLFINAFADRIGLVNVINRLVPSKMEIDPGILVLAMVLDALSGRHPLYRIESFYENKDIELLLGQPLDGEKLTDDNFGRMLDLLYAANTTHVFSEIAMNALRIFQVPTQHIHFDTTAVTVYGAYEPTDPNSPSTLKITKGYSKDHRPELNQFLISLMWSGGNVPIFSSSRTAIHWIRRSITPCSRTFPKAFQGGIDPVPPSILQTALSSPKAICVWPEMRRFLSAACLLPLANTNAD